MKYNPQVFFHKTVKYANVQAIHIILFIWLYQMLKVSQLVVKALA